MPIGQAVDETRLVLDTMILTHWASQQLYAKRAIADYMTRLKRPPALATINVFESLWGFEKEMLKPGGDNERTTRGRAKTEELIQDCLILPFDENAARIAAYIFPRLSQKERNEHWEDLFIAATALAHGYGVASGNHKDFKLIADYLPPTHPLLRLAVWKP